MTFRIPTLLTLGVVLAITDSTVPSSASLTQAQENPRSEPIAQRPSKANTIVRRLSNAEVVEILDDLGYESEEVEPGSFTFEMNGVIVALLNGESNLQLYAGFAQEYDLEELYRVPRLINEWNRTKRFSRAYLDEDGDPCVESDVDLEGGVTLLAVDEFLQTFTVSVTTFLEWLEEGKEQENNRARQATSIPDPTKQEGRRGSAAPDAQ